MGKHLFLLMSSLALSCGCAHAGGELVMTPVAQIQSSNDTVQVLNDSLMTLNSVIDSLREKIDSVRGALDEAQMQIELESHDLDSLGAVLSYHVIMEKRTAGKCHDYAAIVKKKPSQSIFIVNWIDRAFQWTKPQVKK